MFIKLRMVVIHLNDEGIYINGGVKLMPLH